MRLFKALANFLVPLLRGLNEYLLFFFVILLIPISMAIILLIKCYKLTGSGRQGIPKMIIKLLLSIVLILLGLVLGASLALYYHRVFIKLFWLFLLIALIVLVQALKELKRGLEDIIL